MTIQSKVESLLFVVGDDGLTLQQLAHITEVEELELKDVLAQLQQQLEQDDTRGVTLKELAGTYQLVTKQSMADTIQKLIENPPAQSMSQASLEVLAIVAYKQPITRVEVEDLRGVKCERPIQTLVSKGLIQEVGRVEGTGRAILYGTTKEFLNFFGLNDLRELPPLPQAEQDGIDGEQDLFMTKFQEAFEKDAE
ncbi:SMC-Scp complex subunit ScpB [Caryophanon tenue]|uniref:Segregation and condensation protein B n=1 Tax=Caryophanon tenue TaxID=33978 RepID=A0A1C0YKV7_9BACL|nr:SMC-Scp complex subunit ScpB [Caryophanon tenue]OCS87781.1 SMC-Scp complex subunit ScpB [Caryophanon tenue]